MSFDFDDDARESIARAFHSEYDDPMPRSGRATYKQLRQYIRIAVDNQDIWLMDVNARLEGYFDERTPGV